MKQLLVVAAGGALGAVCRYAVGVACISWLGIRFPYATLLVNVSGCFLLGLLVPDGAIDRFFALAHPGVTIGLLGAFTTFSTFGYETIRFAEQGEWRLAVLNVAGNVVLGCVAAAGGMAASRGIWHAMGDG